MKLKKIYRIVEQDFFKSTGTPGKDPSWSVSAADLKKNFNNPEFTKNLTKHTGVTGARHLANTISKMVPSAPLVRFTDAEFQQFMDHLHQVLDAVRHQERESGNFTKSTEQ